MRFSFFKIKNRVVIATIFTLLVIFASNKLWLDFSPIPVSFDVEGKGKYKIEVQLNKKDDEEFKKIKGNTANVDFDNEKHAVISIMRSKMPKRMQIIFSNPSDKTSFILKNIQIKKEKLDLNKFVVNNGTLKINGDALIIIPNVNVASITLLYKEKLNVITDIKIDYNLFIIIAVLTFLLFYKLSNYLADFKNVENHSRIEIIFLSIFFVSLFIPMSYINTDEISSHENRALSRWQPFILKDGKINFGFGKAFDNWFNDRFLMRDFFISVYDKKFLLSKNWRTPKVIKGKEDWLFFGTKEAIANYTNDSLFTEDELKKITDYLIKVNQYCEKNGKKFYLFIPPDKSKVYGEFYSDVMKPKTNLSRVNQLLDYLKTNSDIKVIYPLDEFLKQKKVQPVYFKLDTHWSYMGAYFGYLELMKVIQNDFNDINIFKAQDYVNTEYFGDLNNMLPDILKTKTSIQYAFPVVDLSNISCTVPVQEKDIVNCKNNNQSRNILVFRDSFSNTQIPYIASSFKKAMFIWQYDVVPSAMYDADIILLEVAEITLPSLVDSKLEEN